MSRKSEYFERTPTLPPGNLSGLDHKFVEREGIYLNPVQNILWCYWLRLYDATGNVPYRSSFDPAKIAAILPYIGISEKIDDDTQRIRLVGTAHDCAWPENITGKNLFDYVSPCMAQHRRSIYDLIFSRGWGCLTDETAEAANGRRVSYQGLLLPLRNAKGKATMIIGAYTYLATPNIIEELNTRRILNRYLQNATFITV